MKILHTSDWHLGRTLRGADLTPAFEIWADFIVDTAREHAVDAVLISGDVYDRGMPPVAMVELLSRTLERLSAFTHVVLTSGNHDSAKRLGFGSGLMRPEITFRTDSLDCARPVVVRARSKVKNPGDGLRDDGVTFAGNASYGEPSSSGALIYALPYLAPDVERTKLSESDEPLPRSHEAVVEAALGRIREDILHGEHSINREPGVPRIIMAHEFVIGGDKSDSEQDITIGGVESVPSALFDVRGESGEPLIDYVALGHLHGPQQVGQEGEPIMRYSGSPVAFSFSEERHTKSVALLEFKEQAPDTPRPQPKVTLIPVPVWKPIVTLEDSFEALLSGKYSDYREHFVRAVVTDPDRPTDMYARLKREFPFMLIAHHLGAVPIINTQAIAAKQARPHELLEEFFETNLGRELETSEAQLLEDLWDEFIKAKVEE